jgi:hypothetical protein
VALAEARAAARAERDWATADELKARLEAAGWRVIDRGPGFELEPARLPDVVEDGQTSYGTVDSVPSLQEQPDGSAATVVVVAGVRTEQVPATLQALADHSPADTQVVVVAERGMPIDGPYDELIRTAAAFGPGDAISVALRRATGTIVIVLEPGQLPLADIVTPLRQRFDDPGIAIAGSHGLRSADLHRYQAAEAGDVTTLASGCYAFRRADAIERGPIDGRLQLPDSVAAWWGLRLRDEGPHAEPRRAVALDLPLQPRGDSAPTSEADARRARRDAYRISDRFRACRWLAADLPPEWRLVGDGAEHDDHGDAADEGRHTDPA